MTDKMREEFEASVLSEYPNQNMGKFATGEYQSTTIEHCWWAWKKSRETLVIELPPARPEPISSGDELKSDGEAASWNIWVGDKLAKAECREAIEAAGLKVKS